MTTLAKSVAWAGGKCRVPMWSMGVPDGFCDKEAFGEQLPRPILEQERGYGRTHNPIPYCYGPCCPGHGGPKADEPRLFMDGHGEDGRPMWCAVNPGFENLQESPAGFSQDPFAARAALRDASAGEAGTATDSEAGVAEGEHATRQGDAQTASPLSNAPTPIREDGRTGANGQLVELMEIGGRTVEVDAEIAPLVRALNNAGMVTRASCSGHGFRPADIALADGREIIIARDHAEARRINALFPIDINGNEVQP